MEIWAIVGIAILIALASISLRLRRLANLSTGHEVTPEFIAGDPSKRTLVVVMHGLAGNKTRLEPLIGLIQRELPQAAVLLLSYPSGWLSNSSPLTLSSAIARSIQRHFDQLEKGPEPLSRQVILVGYSFGSLLLRQALLFGLGEVRGDPGAVESGQRETREWANCVRRIVLIAGMNRGWHLNKQLTGLHFYQRWLAKAIRPLLRVLRVSDLLFAIEQGSPFVADLRMQWMQAAVRRDEAFPLVVQILGKRDEFVTRKDETDIAISTGFWFLDAGEADHTSILEVDRPGEPQEMIKAALREDPTALAMIASIKKPRDRMRARVEHIIFVRHGIRDDNRWAPRLRARLCEAAKAAGMPCVDSVSSDYTGPLSSINIDSYGYFGMLPFLFRSQRQKKMRDFMDQYVEEVAAVGDPDVRVDFLGHSNGTYVLAAGLEAYATLKVRRVIFANSVVQRDYPWPAFVSKEQVTGLIRNYTGASDWVVATFPRLFELHGFGDLGSAGFAGFTKGSGANGNVTVPGGHGAGIDPSLWDQQAQFFFADSPSSSPSALNQSGWTEVLWKIPYIGWGIVLILGGLVGWGMFELVGLTPGLGPNTRFALQLIATLVVIVRLLILI